MLLSVPSILLFMWSFVALRVQQPTAPRPFRIPGGLATAVLITVVPVAISLAYAAIVATDSLLLGRPERASGKVRSTSHGRAWPRLALYGQKRAGPAELPYY